MAILVTGGAGYIGSHMVWALADRGERTVVVDNLSTGVRKLVAPSAVFVEGDCGDSALIRSLIFEHAVDVIVHFAGSIMVPESATDPLAYYANNAAASRNLIAVAVVAGARSWPNAARTGSRRRVRRTPWRNTPIAGAPRSF